ncbi:MAG: alpha/beta hydrolase, partial [Terracidiphilus sp.]|nr:alpha/beta hydrolase [Terracidiphilus sp.]
KRAKEKLPQLPVQTLLQVQTDVREVTEAEAVPGNSNPSAGPDLPLDWPAKEEIGSSYPERKFMLSLGDGSAVVAHLIPAARKEGRHRSILLLVDDGDPFKEEGARQLSESDGAVLAITPRPSPPGGEETKAAILGPFYMTELRAELVGRTILGMRVDDVIRAVDYLAKQPGVDPNDLVVLASGHMGLVALHAAVLDPRIKHVMVDHVLESYQSLLKAPMPLDAPQDILPGVLLKYDIPDLVRVLGDRVTATDWLPGTADLSGK